MHRFFTRLLAIVAFAWAAPAQAEISTDSVRDALASENFAYLETEFEKAYQQALEQQDFEALRDVYRILFLTANETRLDRTQRWLAAYPDSFYAATGLAWSHLYRAYQVRGGLRWDWTTAELQNRYLEELARSKEMADFAFGKEQAFVPAIDITIQLMGTAPYKGDVRPFVDLSLRHAPNRHTLETGLDALTLDNRDDIENTITLCTLMSHRVAGYDAELCLIEAAFKNKATGYLREVALQALARRDEPFLDYARLDAYLSEWSGTENAAAEVMRIHRETLDKRPNVHKYLRLLDDIEMVFGAPLYAAEMRAALIDKMYVRLVDNPQSHNILEFLIKDILARSLRKDPRADISLAEELWQDMLPLGAYRADTWDVGLDVHLAAHPTFSPTPRIEFATNQIYYSRHSPGYIRGLMSSLDNLYNLARDEHQTVIGKAEQQALLAEVECPMFRSARVFRMVCDQVPDAYGCNIGGYNADLADRIARMVLKPAECVWAGSVAPELLYYTPVPIEKFQKGPSQ